MRYPLKKAVCAVLCVGLLLSLLGCSAENTAPETVPPSEDTLTAVTEPQAPDTLALEGGMVRGGLYTLDTSAYEFTFDEVLLDLDLAGMTFQLQCFDGNVLSGTLRTEGDLLICDHEGGRMMFYVEPGDRLVSTKHMGGKDYVVSDQVMICPQTESSFQYRFTYAADQEKTISPEADQDFLDDYKHLYHARYSFLCMGGKPGEETGCGLSISYFPMQDKWTMQKSSQSTEAVYTENPDGSVTFSQGKEQWHFHWEEQDLVYDGGSPLVADNGVDPAETYYVKADVPVGSVFRAQNCSYVYDGLYILPGKNLEEGYAGIQLDTKNQYIRIQCANGMILRGPYTFIDDIYLYCSFEVPDYVGTRTAYVTLWPSEHALGVSNGWMMEIGPGEMGDTFYFTPVQGVQPPETTDS